MWTSSLENPSFLLTDKYSVNLHMPEGQSGFPFNKTITYGKYYCDVCDRTFFSSENYDKHNATHVQCEYEGCKFYGSEKLVEMHVETQHLTGLANKIMAVESEEDIVKWREERKKNFPTKFKVESLIAEKEERKARGEVLDKKAVRFRRRNNAHVHTELKKGFGRAVRCKINTVEDSSEEDEELIKFPSFSGSKIIRERYPEENNTVESSEDEIENRLTDNISDDENALCEESSGSTNVLGGLGMLIGAYDSSSSELEEGEIQDSKDEVTPELDTMKSKKLFNPFLPTPSKSIPDEVPKRIDQKLNKPLERFQGKRRCNKKSDSKRMKTEHKPQLPTKPESRPSVQTDDALVSAGFPFPSVKLKAPKRTLLRALLHSEIQHERNIVLQCVRYIVSKNFFQKTETQNRTQSINNECINESFDCFE